VPTTEVLVVVVLVGVLAVLHVIQWIAARPAAPAFAPPGEMLRDLAGGVDSWTRAFLATAIVAISFAALAPFVSQIGDVLGRGVPG
jgi:hypothetical protein